MFCRPGRGRGAIHVGRPDRLTSRRGHGAVGPNVSPDLVACRWAAPGHGPKTCLMCYMSTGTS